MASMYYDKKTKRWRVCWRVTLPDGTIDSGSKTFGRDKKTAKRFKELLFQCGTVESCAARLAGDSESRENNNSLYSTLPGKNVIVSFR